MWQRLNWAIRLNNYRWKFLRRIYSSDVIIWSHNNHAIAFPNTFKIEAFVCCIHIFIVAWSIFRYEIQIEISFTMSVDIFGWRKMKIRLIKVLIKNDRYKNCLWYVVCRCVCAMACSSVFAEYFELLQSFRKCSISIWSSVECKINARTHTRFTHTHTSYTISFVWLKQLMTVNEWWRTCCWHSVSVCACMCGWPVISLQAVYCGHQYLFCSYSFCVKKRFTVLIQLL